MKRTIMMSFAMVLMLATFAQKPAGGPPQGGGRPPRMTPEERAKQATDRLNAAVQLSQDQYQKVLAINNNFFTQRAALHTPGQEMSDDARAKAKALGKDRDEKTKAVLTPEQVKKWEEGKKQEHEKHMGEGGGGWHGGGDE